MIPRRAVKIKFFLSVVIPVVKGDFVPFSAIGGNPANAGVARLCGVSPCPVPDTATALPKQARYQLRYTRLLSYSIRLVVFTQTTRATNCANPGFLVIQFCSRCGQTCGQAVFLTTSTCGGSACIAGVSRDCGHGIFRLEGGATRSQSRRATNFAIPGYFFSIPQLRVEGKRKFLVYINKVVIGGRLPADDDLIQICIKRLACCALRQREGDIRAEKVGVDGQVEAAALQLHQAAGDG